MRRRAALLAATAGLVLSPAAGAQHGGDGHGAAPPVAAPIVSIGFAAFATPRLDVLTGDTVTWTNDSVRAHTVTALDESWSSAQLLTGERFARAFPVAGAYPYLCRLHPFMAGEVDAHDALLAPPAGAAGPGRRFPLAGRAAAPAGTAVAIEGDTGAGFAPAATAAVEADGTFHATVMPATTTTYRAAVAGGAPSPPVTLLVLDRRVAVTVARRGGRTRIAATVSPATPGATVVLQLRLRERFGWWPVRTTRLDAHSSARFDLRVARPVRARVLLTLADGATALADSGPIVLRASRPR